MPSGGGSWDIENAVGGGIDGVGYGDSDRDNIINDGAGYWVKNDVGGIYGVVAIV